ncbi:MAG: N-acetylmuramoyl-L-alanine amidase [Myxococcaceae bacterium]|nr:N-acetylmuramoyl-L-alanine amidase [Myxococcaceae bacterium]
MTPYALLIAATLFATNAKPTDPAEAAWQAAKTARTELKGDEKRRRFRHHWQNVAKKLEGVAQKYPKSPRAAEALVLAAQTYEELSKFSANPEDLEAARKLYAKAPKPVVKPAPAAPAAKATRRAESSGDASAAAPTVRAEPSSAKGRRSTSRGQKAAEAQVLRIADAFKKLDLPVPERDRAPVAEEAAAVSETPGLHVPSVEELAEKLRDVRVGERDVKALRGAAIDQELTLAEQLGLKVKRVIIDAGHGGHDTGAIGKNGTREKDVALAIALKLSRLLTEAGLEVLMTRDDDTFVRLEDRTAFANKKKGDLFISVHCNSAPTKNLGGVETYTLNTSSDRYNVRLAARENQMSDRGVGDLQLILADLATKANTEESGRLANRVQRELVTSLKNKNPSVRDLGHKEALFFVLLGAKMPAILVETSFLSNATEERLLASEAYQLDVAEAIAEGVNGFLEERNKVAQVD